MKLVYKIDIASNVHVIFSCNNVLQNDGAWFRIKIALLFAFDSSNDTHC